MTLGLSATTVKLAAVFVADPSTADGAALAAHAALLCTSGSRCAPERGGEAGGEGVPGGGAAPWADTRDDSIVRCVTR